MSQMSLKSESETESSFYSSRMDDSSLNKIKSSSNTGSSGIELVEFQADKGVPSPQGVVAIGTFPSPFILYFFFR